MDGLVNTASSFLEEPFLYQLTAAYCTLLITNPLFKRLYEV